MLTPVRHLVAAALALGAGGGCSRPAGAPRGESRPPARPYLNMPAVELGGVPARLSLTGAFADVRTLTPDPALVAYDVNVPFWSDGAAKRRWVAVPDQPIRFDPAGPWGFPAGTVFVKHFELAGRRVETRLLVRDAAGGVYGVC